jgi:Bacterial pre-peptidase C-terminal domain
MKTILKIRQYSLLLSLTTCLTLVQSLTLKAETIYKPIPLSSNQELSNILTDQDIPTGDGGFSRDYKINLKKGDQVAIDLISDDFDTKVFLIGADGTSIAENDDGPDGSTNSLLFVRITEEENYIVRVSAFGETGGGKFTLKVTRLQSIDECKNKS